MFIVIFNAVLLIIHLFLFGYHDVKSSKIRDKLGVDSDNKRYEIELKDHRYKAVVHLGMCIVFILATISTTMVKSGVLK